MRDFLVYLAGPITGLTYGESTTWRNYVRDAFPDHIHSLSPMRGKVHSQLKGEGPIHQTYEDNPLTSEKGINQRDYNDVKRSDAILANFLGADILSVGTLFEIAWARAFQIPLVLVMGEDNIHNHPFVRYSAGFITSNLDKGIELIETILGTDRMLKPRS